MTAEASTKDKALRARKIEENMGLVRHAATRFMGRGYEYEELLQIGTVGLIHAVDRFDESKGYAFSTYAIPLIIGELQCFFRGEGRIHIPRSVKQNLGKVQKARETLEFRQGREPRLEELARETQLSVEEILEALSAEVSLVPLEAPAYYGQAKESESIGELIPDEKTYNENQLVEEIALKEALEALDDQEKQFLRLRYGQGRTQSETARLLGLTQVAVSRREKKILLHLRGQLGYNELNVTQ